MAELGPLLEVAELDLESDRLRDRHANMPEREALRRSETRRAAFAREQSDIASRRADLSEKEETLGSEVATVAAKAAEVEKTLYSGTVKIAKELEALQVELRLLKRRQGELEGEEMELLEAIEAVDEEEAKIARVDRNSEAESRQLETQIAASEEEIAQALANCEVQRAARTPGIPAPVLKKYEALRDKPRLAGRAAARLGEGICEGCLVKLPVMEYRRMKDEPPDVLIQCSSCRRVLVRTE